MPYPIKNARYTVLIPYLDADGDPTDPTTPDTEVSQDGGAFADAAEEMTTITGSNGMGYVTLTGAETNNSAVGVACKVASGPKATLATLYPRNLPILESGTAGAGAAGTITLASGTYTGLNLAGCFIRTTGGTGGGGTGGASNQARRITSYNTGTRVATITPNWETTPDNTTTYDVLLPEGILIPMLTALAPTTLARTLDVSSTGEAGLDWANVGSPTTSLALTGTTIATTQKVDIETIKTNPVVNGGTVTFPTTATLASTTNITAGTVTTATNVTTVNGLGAGVITATAINTDAITAAKIADGAIDRATFAADTGLQSARSNTAQAGAAGTITLDASASATTDFYVGMWVFLTGGTGVGQARVCTAYNGTTKVATIAPNWATNPDVTSTFAVLTAAQVTGVQGNITGSTASVTGNIGGNVTGSIGSVAAGGIASSSFAAGAIDNAAMSINGSELTAIPWNAAWDAEVQSEVADALIAYFGVDAATFIDTIWDEAVSGSRTARKAIRLLLAVAVGKASGLATATAVYRNPADTIDAVVAGVDSDGNRASVTLDDSA